MGLEQSAEKLNDDEANDSKLEKVMNKEEVNKYLKRIKKIKEGVKLNENVKKVTERNIIVVGRSKVGKSTIIQVLKDPCYESPEFALFHQNQVRNSKKRTTEYESFSVRTENEIIKLNFIEIKGSDHFNQHSEDQRIDLLKLGEKYNITQIHMMILAISHDHGVNKSDLNYFEQMWREYIHLDLRIIICCTRSEQNTLQSRSQIRNELINHPFFSQLFLDDNNNNNLDHDDINHYNINDENNNNININKNMDADDDDNSKQTKSMKSESKKEYLFFSGCVSKDYLKINTSRESLLATYQQILHMRNKFLHEIIHTTNSVSLLDLPISEGLKSAIEDSLFYMGELLKNTPNAQTNSEFLHYAQTITPFTSILNNTPYEEQFLDLMLKYKYRTSAPSHPSPSHLPPLPTCATPHKPSPKTSPIDKLNNLSSSHHFSTLQFNENTNWLNSNDDGDEVKSLLTKFPEEFKEIDDMKKYLRWDSYFNRCLPYN